MPASTILYSDSKNRQHESAVPPEPLHEDHCSAEPSKRKQKILLADDDQYLRRMAAELLRTDGYDVTEVSNGREALAQVRLFKPDIVVTEIVMPEVEGLQLIQEVLQLDPQIKILAVSGTFRAENYLRIARALGARATLLKPLTGDALLKTIREISDER